MIVFISPRVDFVGYPLDVFIPMVPAQYLHLSCSICTAAGDIIKCLTSIAFLPRARVILYGHSRLPFLLPFVALLNVVNSVLVSGHKKPGSLDGFWNVVKTRSQLGQALQFGPPDPSFSTAFVGVTGEVSLPQVHPVYLKFLYSMSHLLYVPNNTYLFCCQSSDLMIGRSQICSL